MFIKRIEVRNFKSFDHLDIELGNFNLVIGANASGKSNFVQIFRFLRDIATYPLIDALSLSGGEYFLNRNIGTSENFFLKVVVAPDNLEAEDFLWEITTDYSRSKSLEREKWKLMEIIYEFSLEFPQNKEFKVFHEGLILKVVRNGEEKAIDKAKPKEIKILREGDEIKKPHIPTELYIFPEQLLDIEAISILAEKRRFPQQSLTLSVFTPSGWELMHKLSRNIGIYNVNPTLLKRPVPLEEVSTLKEDGSNLTLAVREILKYDKQREKFLRLVRYALPFVSEIDVARFFDQSMLLTLKEAYLKEPLPGFIISDGTANILALILALYFNSKDIIIIEEPERNIHPALIGKIVEMMKDASQNKQIIATTHNPELVKHAGLDHLLLVYRDQNGFSKITKPAERETVREFLKGEIGLDDLYVQNLLEVL
jgi:predicted ATPase